MANVTIYSLAKELNMTPSMVSRALSPNGKVSEEKRKIVLAAAEKYGFSVNKFASRLSMKNVNIGVIINVLWDVAKEKMILGIEEAHRELKDYKIKYDVTIINSERATIEDYEGAINKYKNYDGVILTGMSSAKFEPLINDLLKANPNVVQVQSANENLGCLFSSKHNEKVAAELAAEFLYNSLKKSASKNILLFTGSLESSLHKSSKKAFNIACNELGLKVVDQIDMKDSNEYLQKIVDDVFKKHGKNIDGIYITSGISSALCEYLKENNLDLSFVTFDIYEHVKDYMNNGVISATIYQNLSKQMSTAFTLLSKHIISGEKFPNVVYTDVQLVLKSNLHQFN